MTTISWWQHTTNIPHPAEPLPAEPPKVRTEVCIVGAGIAGTSAAYLLRKAGIDTIVVDAAEPAMGATGRNAGFFLTGVGFNYADAIKQYGRERARQLWQLTLDNREAMINIATKIGAPVKRNGSWHLADSHEEAEELAQAAALMAEDGFNHEFVAHDPLGRGFLAALGMPEDGTTHSAQLVLDILKASGTKVLAYAPVQKMEASSSGRGMIVTTPRAIISCKNVFLATNAYSAQLHPFFEGKVQPNRGQIYITAPAPLLIDRACSSQNGYYYFQQIPDPERPGYGRFLMGGARNHSFATENGHYHIETSEVIQIALEAYTGRYFPELKDVPIERRWAGTMGFTKDYLPMIGQLPDLPRVTYCVGFSGHGMVLALKSVEHALMQLLDGRVEF